MLASETRPPAAAAAAVHAHDPRRRGSRRLSLTTAQAARSPPRHAARAPQVSLGQPQPAAALANLAALQHNHVHQVGPMPTTPSHAMMQQQQNGGGLGHVPPPLSHANHNGGGGGGGRGSGSRRPSHSAASPSSPSSDKEQALYKTELCSSYSTNGKCRYGAKCQFAHGKEELRHVARHPKYKTELCRNFSLMGTCVYEQRCRFIHDESNDELSQLNCLNSPARCVTHGHDTSAADARMKAARNHRHSIATGSPAHDMLLHHRDLGLPAGFNSAQFHPQLVQFTYGAMGGRGGVGGIDGPPPSASAGTAYGAHPHPGGREAAERRRRSGPPIMMHPGSHRAPLPPTMSTSAIPSPMPMDEHFFQGDFDLDRHAVPAPPTLKAIRSLNHVPDGYRPPPRGDVHRARSASVSTTDVNGLLPPFANGGGAGGRGPSPGAPGGPPLTSSAFYRQYRLPEDGPSAAAAQGADGSDGASEDAARRGSQNLSPSLLAAASAAAAAAKRSSPYARHAPPRGPLERSGSMGRLFPQDRGPPSVLGNGYQFGRRRHSSVLHESSALRSSMAPPPSELLPPIDLRDGVGLLPPGMRRSPRGSFSGVPSPGGTSSSSTDHAAPSGQPNRSPLLRSRSPTRPQSATNAAGGGAKKQPIGPSPRNSLADTESGSRPPVSGGSASARHLGAAGRRVSTPGLRYTSAGRTSAPSSPHTPDFGDDFDAMHLKSNHLQPIGTPSQRHLGDLHMKRLPPRSQSLFALHAPYGGGGLLGPGGMSAVEGMGPGMTVPSPRSNGFRKPPMKFANNDDLFLHTGPPPRSALAKRRESSPATGMIPPSVAARLMNGIHNTPAARPPLGGGGNGVGGSVASKTPRSIGAITEEPGPPGRVRRAASEAGIPRHDLKPTAPATTTPADAAEPEQDFFDNFKSLSLQKGTSP